MSSSSAMSSTYLGGGSAQTSTGGATASSNNILSGKVSRALEVRTDTPAMKAALEALGQLPSSANLDAKSVRGAIEQDALRQALDFQAELLQLVDTVANLRSSVSQVSRLAAHVSASIDARVMVTTTPTAGEAGKPATLDSADDVIEGTDDLGGDESMLALRGAAGGSSETDEERQLAHRLWNSFCGRSEALARVEAVTQFLEKFDLSERHSALLDAFTFESVSSSTAPPSESEDAMDFLNALERVRAIRRQLSLGPSSALSTAGSAGGAGGTSGLSAVRMMENLAQKQEQAYNRLYNFLQSYLKLDNPAASMAPTSSAALATRSGATASLVSSALAGYTEEDDDGAMDEVLSTDVFVRKSLRLLRTQVPAYYSHLMELIASHRRSEVTRRFLLALTAGYQGLAPIEMRAHDPNNYVGDMLAFCFRALSVECDIVAGLFAAEEKDSARKDNEGEDGKEDDNEEGEAKAKDDGEDENEEDGWGDDDVDEEDLEASPTATAFDVLSQSVGGICRPLKSRIMQVVSSLSRRQVGTRDGATPEGEDLQVDDDDEEEDNSPPAFVNRLTSLYSICGLLVFYQSAMTKSVSKLKGVEDVVGKKKSKKAGDGVEDDDEEDPARSNPLVDCIKQAMDEAALAFGVSTRVYSATTSIGTAAEGTPASLAQMAIVQLSEVRSTSPGFAADVFAPSASSRPEAMKALTMEFVIDTLLEGVLGPASSATASASSEEETTQPLPSTLSLDDCIALRSSLSTARKLGGLVDSTQWDLTISHREREVAQGLIDSATKHMLQDCGLAPLLSSLTTNTIGDEEDDPLAAAAPTIDVVERQMRTFYASLYAPPIPTFESSVRDSALRKYARQSCTEALADTYETIYDRLFATYRQEELAFLGHTPQQVKTLLSL